MMMMMMMMSMEMIACIFTFVFLKICMQSSTMHIGVTLSSQNLKTQLHNIIIIGEAIFVLFKKMWFPFVLGLAYQEGKDIVFRFIIEYSSFRDFYRLLGNNNNNNRSIFI
jgi:hypothetical protein